MARINNLVNFLTDIANAIRNKTGKSTTIQPIDMDTEIGSIQTQPNLQSKSVEITENTTTNITADSGYDGLSEVEVTTDVSGGGSIPDWSLIGYSEPPEALIDDFNYAKNIYDNWADVQSLSGKYIRDYSLVYFPAVSTNNATDLQNMFYGSSNLVYIPVLTFSNRVNSMNNMFSGCTNLSNEALNNILQTCINSQMKLTLRYIGLSSAQANICETLPNWDAFIVAGWSKGY